MCSMDRYNSMRPSYFPYWLGSVDTAAIVSWALCAYLKGVTSVYYISFCGAQRLAFLIQHSSGVINESFHKPTTPLRST